MKTLIIISFILLINCVPTFAFSGGNGTKENPYQISSKADMELLADSVNNGTNWGRNKYFIVMNDIDDSIRTSVGKSYAHNFKGNFDGQNYKITLATTLFYVASDAEIKNVIVDGYIGIGSSSNTYVSGILGIADSNVSITNCVNLAHIESNSAIGGIVGRINNSTSITNCVNLAHIKGVASIGGIVGWINYSSFSRDMTSIINCVNLANIEGISGIGGIVGECIGNTTDKYIAIQYCTNAGYIAGQNYVGGIIGRVSISIMQISYCINTGVVVSRSNNAYARIGCIVGNIAENNSNLTITNCEWDKQMCPKE